MNIENQTAIAAFGEINSGFVWAALILLGLIALSAIVSMVRAR